MTKELLQQALDALITAIVYVDNPTANDEVLAALNAVEEALAQQEHPCDKCEARLNLGVLDHIYGKEQPAQKHGNYKCPTCEHEQSSGEIECNNCGRTYLVEAPPTQLALSDQTEWIKKNLHMLEMLGPIDIIQSWQAHCRGGTNK